MFNTKIILLQIGIGAPLMGCGSFSDPFVDESNALRISKYEFDATAPGGTSGGIILSSQPRIKGSLRFFDATDVLLEDYPLKIKLSSIGITVKYDHKITDVKIKFSSINKKRIEQIIGSYSSGTKFGGGFISGSSGADATNGAGVSIHVGSNTKGSLGVDISMSNVKVEKDSFDSNLDWTKTIIIE